MASSLGIIFICKYRKDEKLYTLEAVCYRYVTVNTLHRSDKW